MTFAEREGKFMSFRVFSALMILGLSSQAFASHHHRAIFADNDPASNSPCTFPDGSHPGKRTEIHCYDPQHFLQAYGIDKLHAPKDQGGLGLTGKGQTIILVDSFGSPTAQQDLDHFSDVFNL